MATVSARDEKALRSPIDPDENFIPDHIKLSPDLAR